MAIIHYLVFILTVYLQLITINYERSIIQNIFFFCLFSSISFLLSIHTFPHPFCLSFFFPSFYFVILLSLILFSIILFCYSSFTHSPFVVPLFFCCHFILLLIILFVFPPFSFHHSSFVFYHSSFFLSSILIFVQNKNDGEKNSGKTEE